MFVYLLRSVIPDTPDSGTSEIVMHVSLSRKLNRSLVLNYKKAAELEMSLFKFINKGLLSVYDFGRDDLLASTSCGASGKTGLNKVGCKVMQIRY